MGRHLCGYAAQLNVDIFELYGFMTLADDSGSCAGMFMYQLQLNFHDKAGGPDGGIWVNICQPIQSGGGTGGEPTVVVTRDPSGSTGNATWPDGTQVFVDGFSCSGSDGCTFRPMADPRVVKVMTPDPAFDPPFAPIPPSASPTG